MEYKTLLLKNLCAFISRGVTPSYTEEDGVVVINQKCIRDNKVNYSLARLTDTEKRKVNQDKYIKSYDVLINSTGVGTLGRVAQVKEIDYPLTADSHVMIVRANDDVYKPFLGYALFAQQAKIEQLGHGSTGQTELSRVRLGDSIEIPLPPLSTQRRIAAILSSLDDKIENNRKTAEKLEEIAQAIFKRWFVDFDGEYTTHNLDELATITMGQSPPSSTYNYDKLGIPFYQGSKEFGWRKPTRDKWCSEPKRIANKNDILISVRAPVGDMNIATEKCCIGRGLASIRGNEINTSILFYAIKYNLTTIKNHSSAGSVFDSLNKKTLAEVKIKLPSDEVQSKYGNMIDRIFEEINLFDDEILLLEDTRDTLLPKLMSGEIEL